LSFWAGDCDCKKGRRRPMTADGREADPDKSAGPILSLTQIDRVGGCGRLLKADSPPRPGPRWGCGIVGRPDQAACDPFSCRPNSAESRLCWVDAPNPVCDELSDEVRLSRSWSVMACVGSVVDVPMDETS
jgi:hypothetical protein